MTATVDILKIIELKKTLDEKFGLYLHIHDGCGGQYFTVDNITPQGKDFIVEYFRNMKYSVVFNSDENEFYLEDIRQC